MKEEINPRFLRLKHIIGDYKAIPPIQPIIPVAKSTWWDGVKKGKYPKPYKIGNNITVWRSDEIQALVDDLCKNRVD
ncbi:AlpA family phage regulatory protein [Alphaproteobacteria bacterium]|nr:AlpA family phage regulatory protein [Alphaproteobacteria bacterium]